MIFNSWPEQIYTFLYTVFSLYIWTSRLRWSVTVVSCLTVLLERVIHYTCAPLDHSSPSAYKTLHYSAIFLYHFTNKQAHYVLVTFLGWTHLHCSSFCSSSALFSSFFLFFCRCRCLVFLFGLLCLRCRFRMGICFFLSLSQRLSSWCMSRIVTRERGRRYAVWHR